jgi:hypothetical protein
MHDARDATMRGAPTGKSVRNLALARHVYPLGQKLDTSCAKRFYPGCLSSLDLAASGGDYHRLRALLGKPERGSQPEAACPT